MGPTFPAYSSNLYHLLVAVLVALEHRRRTAEGAYIDLSRVESTATWLGPAILDYTANGRVPIPAGNPNPDWAPHSVYPTQGDDRWLAIAVDEESWPAFVVVTGAEFDPARFGTHALRKAHEDELDALVASWTVHHEGEVLTEQLQAAGVAAAVVATADDLIEHDPQASLPRPLPSP
ncbi:MAG: CoA transferase [Chloroflexi bacterium]|nr:CoA transferase [Chloroflexota bacterium]